MNADSLTFSGVIANGKVRPMGHAPTLAAFCQRLGDGTELLITVEEKKDTRSLRANRLYWGAVIAPLAEYFGYDADEKDNLHEGLLSLYTGTHQDKATGQQVPNKRSKAMNTKEFSEYIEFIVRWAAKEHGVTLLVDLEAA